MRMAVQEDIDVLRRPVGWNVDEPKAEAAAFQIDGQRPFDMTVAISPHHRDRWPDSLDRFQNARSAHISQMPDFIRPFRQRLNVTRQMIVRVRQHKDAEWK